MKNKKLHNYKTTAPVNRAGAVILYLCFQQSLLLFSGDTRYIIYMTADITTIRIPTTPSIFNSKYIYPHIIEKREAARQTEFR